MLRQMSSLGWLRPYHPRVDAIFNLYCPACLLGAADQFLHLQHLGGSGWRGILLDLSYLMFSNCRSIRMTLAMGLVDYCRMLAVKAAL